MPTPPRDDPDNSLVVLKFGGTSVATADRWATIARIVRDHRQAGRQPLLVCSATAGTSDALEALLDAVADGEAVAGQLAALGARHRALARDLGVDGEALVDPLLDDLARLTEGMRLLGEVSPRSRAAVLATGELLSTRLGAAFLAAQGQDCAWLDARELLESDTPADAPAATRHLSATCGHAPEPALAARVRSRAPVLLTQGFIAADAEGETVLLGRGGSDTSAAYLAARLGAAALEIWTDVPGLFSADPRHVAGARHLEHVTYAQAEALAALGASVLHPRCIGPARDADIPVWVRSTPRPDLDGTRIDAAPGQDGVRAVLTRGDLALVTMRRPAVWQPVGFLAEVTACFQDAGLSIDLVSSSPCTIQATLDLSAAPHPDAALQRLMADLARVCEPELERGLASLSLVGSHIQRHLDRVGPALSLVGEAEPRMVVHAANDAHVTFVVDPARARSLAARLHALLLEPPVDLRLVPRGAVAAEAR